MSFSKTSTSFTRFYIMDDIPPDLYENLPQKLRQFAILDIDESLEERSLGWTSFDDMLDTKWERSIHLKGEYIAFSLRLDTRRIPPAVLKKHVRISLMLEEERMKEQGKKFINRDRRKEITEQVRLRLRGRFLPIPAEFEVVWAMKSNLVYFSSTQKKPIDMFTDLFTQSFDLRLEQVLPYTLAQRILGEGCEDVLDALKQTDFSYK